MTSAVRDLRPGLQLASAVCGVRVIVIRAPAGGGPELTCGGEPMIPAETAKPPDSGGPESEAATLIGKRYVDEAGGVELLCTASGPGALACDGAPMTLKAAKALPASD
ncbi:MULTISPECIES: hypothetical protein [unclassified Streptomyces]|uniref:hypothetical protein n=1 Tax=unclassified Streptomyces TaxID=2593676 RepID=UPI00278BDC1C|nr:MULTISPECIES: hypothetical protein [unclassified Streptomyces]